MSEAFNDWAVLELMGHRRLGGKVQEVEMFGAKMLRIDVPDAKDPETTHATQFYAASALYCLTPCSEEAARAVAKLNQPEPVQRWELPAIEPVKPSVTDDDSSDSDPPDLGPF